MVVLAVATLQWKTTELVQFRDVQIRYVGHFVTFITPKAAGYNTSHS